MANIAPMLGAIMGRVTPPDSKGKKRQPKPKARGAGEQKVTRGEKSVVQSAQQHGELATGKAPTHVQMLRESAKSSMRNATRNWVDGHISGKEHDAIHARARSVLSGKRGR